jgi:hypothetical protein
MCENYVKCEVGFVRLGVTIHHGNITAQGRRAHLHQSNYSDTKFYVFITPVVKEKDPK